MAFDEHRLSVALLRLQRREAERDRKRSYPGLEAREAERRFIARLTGQETSGDRLRTLSIDKSTGFWQQTRFAGSGPFAEGERRKKEKDATLQADVSRVIQDSGDTGSKRYRSAKPKTLTTRPVGTSLVSASSLDIKPKINPELHRAILESARSGQITEKSAADILSEFDLTS